MKLSTKWLKDYLDIDLGKDQLSEILTLIGLEVEGIEEVESVKGGLAGVTIGQVMTCEKHPDADKLSLAMVDLGGEEPVQIVCGAPNVAAGQKVAVATVGTILYDSDNEPFKIKKGKIRGAVSMGMICAEDELGLGAGHDGIMVLDAAAQVGSAAATYFGIESDIVYDIGLTPNRSDATCHIGCAEDLYAYLKINHGYKSSVKRPSISSFDVKHTSKPFDVEVSDLGACPRYSAVTIDNITVGPSPEWMQQRLQAIGVRPISNVVDITNFILHELGQPLHAFDYDKVAGQRIIVRKLEAGTRFTTLDEKERVLRAEDLMICDGDNSPMCIAGVYGGMSSGVTADTKTILLESAHFEAGGIRRTSTKHGLRTDAAKVYEKGSDPSITAFALKRAALLLVKYAGGVIASDVIDVYPQEIVPAEVYLKYSKVRSLIGADISEEEIQNILRAMKMEIQAVDDGTIKVLVPTNKSDVFRDVDLIEEILRIYGFNRIDIPTKITSTITHREAPNKQAITNIVAEMLSSHGYHEMMGLSLIPSQLYDSLGIVEDQQLVSINNTSNIHLDIMRPEMMLSGLLSVVHNHNRQQLGVKLYEYGKTYLAEADAYQETEYLTIMISGPVAKESWRSDHKRSADFYDVKQAVHLVLDRLGISTYQVSELDDARYDYGLHYHRGPKTIARFGAVAAQLADRLGAKTDVYYAELPVQELILAVSNKKETTVPISKYPSMRRDLALVLDDQVEYGAIEAIAKKAGKKLLQSINLFDIYKSEKQLGKGKKSYAVSFTFEDVEKTLKDKDVDKIMHSLMTTYQQQLGAEIRS